MNNRRELIVALGASALAAPLSWFSQPQKGKMVLVAETDPKSTATAAIH